MSLIFCTQDITKLKFNHTNCVIVAIFIAVNEQKFKLLHFFKKVLHLYCFLEGRVERVVDFFCLTNFLPLIEPLLKNDAVCIRHTPSVKILQLPCLYEQIYVNRYSRYRVLIAFALVSCR